MTAETTDENGKAPDQERRFDASQFEFLEKCAAKGEDGIKEWNEWRAKNPGQNILLDGVELSGARLDGILLGRVPLKDDITGDYKLLSGEVYLRGVSLRRASLRRASLTGAHLEGARISSLSDLTDANLDHAYLKSLHVHEVNLAGASFFAADATSLQMMQGSLVGARLIGTQLRNAVLVGGSLERAELSGAEMQGCYVSDVCLCGTSFRPSRVDDQTVVTRCSVDRSTAFGPNVLNSAQIDVSVKQLLECNVRRMNWGKWYKEHPRLHWAVKLFWWISDYGLSTGRIIAVFFGLAVGFAAIYANLQGAVQYMDVEPHVPLWHYFLLLLVRPIYFSIVTMTTLGFGDMYANSHSLWGHVLLTLQVLLGYVLLGALITRFAVLFTAGGPAGRFAESAPEAKEAGVD